MIRHPHSPPPPRKDEDKDVIDAATAEAVNRERDEELRHYQIDLAPQSEARMEIDPARVKGLQNQLENSDDEKNRQCVVM